MCPQGVCHIRKPACAGNGCAIFPTFEAARIGKKIRYPAADDLIRGSLRLNKERGGYAQLDLRTPATRCRIIITDSVCIFKCFFAGKRPGLMARPFRVSY